MRNRIATWIHFVFATVVVIGVFLQAYFIASYFSGAGEGARDAHGFVGGVIVGSEVIVFLSSLVAFWGIWKWVGWSSSWPRSGRYRSSWPRPTTILRAVGFTVCTGSSRSSC